MKKGRRGLALFLAMVMCLSMLQLSAFAAEEDSENPDAVTSTQEAVTESGEDMIAAPGGDDIQSPDEEATETPDQEDVLAPDGENAEVPDEEDIQASDGETTDAPSGEPEEDSADAPAGEPEEDPTDDLGGAAVSGQEDPDPEEESASYKPSEAYADNEDSDIIEEYIALAEQLPNPDELTADNILVVKELLECCLEIEDFIFYECADEALIDRFYEGPFFDGTADKVYSVNEAYKAYVAENGDPSAPAPSVPHIAAVAEGINVTLEDGLFTITGTGTFDGKILVNGIETTVNQYAPGHITAVNAENVTLSGYDNDLFNGVTCLNSLTATNVTFGSNTFKSAFAEGANVRLTGCHSTDYFYQDAFADNAAIAVHLNHCDLAGWLFSGSTLTELTVTEMELREGLFADCTINDNNIDLSTVTAVRSGAFDGTEGSFCLTNIPSNIPLEHSHSFNSNTVSGLSERVLSIFDGSFDMLEPKSAEPIDPQGWTSAKKGKDNAVSSLSTQITEEAKWNDSAETVADVLFQAYCTDVQQMDFVFVMDCSNSMCQKGEEGSLNARFYSMQSKVADVAQQLLSSSEYDCKVAFVGFGGDSYHLDRWNNPITYQPGSLFTSNGFLDNAAEAREKVLDVKPYDEYTNFDIGLGEALKLVTQNQEAGRGTTVILISDGKPEVCDGKYEDSDGNVVDVPDGFKKTLEVASGTDEANAIKAAGAQIIGVLQSVPEKDQTDAKAVMEGICTAGKYFMGDDADGFSDAVNNAIYHALKSYTMSWQISPNFILDKSTMNCSEGTSAEVIHNDSGTFVTWTLSGQTYDLQTLGYQLNLNSDRVNVIGTSTYDVNSGDAVLASGGAAVNTVETPQLSRTVTGYTVTYTDGVDGVELFADQVYSNLLSGAATPAFNGTPTRAGYTFAGWSPEVAETVTGIVTYTAQWTEVRYTVTYTDGVDGVELFADQVYSNLLSGAATPAFSGTPTRAGYTFAGWSPEVAETVAGNATYTAQWTEVTGPVTPDPDPVIPDPVIPDPDPDPVPPVVDVPEEDVPLDETPELPEEERFPDAPVDEPEVIIPDVDVPLAETPEVTVPDVDVPLAEVPEVVIPDVDVPLAEVPEVVIPDEDVPLAEVPEEVPSTAGMEVNIPEELVPLADVPKTGDGAQVWVLLAIASGAGLAWLALEEKKRWESAE
ncbi:MAG: doubled motif LPXTG anchor domain-containing protein [Oscillospiraceae bacterium]|nr:doubled motif LPXTG anchor domain-containing protein [Oscillospiraceae bacterium]